MPSSRKSTPSQDEAIIEGLKAEGRRRQKAKVMRRLTGLDQGAVTNTPQYGPPSFTTKEWAAIDRTEKAKNKTLYGPKGPKGGLLEPMGPQGGKKKKGK